MSAEGWAIVRGDDNRILVETVCPTKVGAAVNFLVVAEGIAVTSLWSEDQIFALFADVSEGTGHRLAKVTITENRDAQFGG